VPDQQRLPVAANAQGTFGFMRGRIMEGILFWLALILVISLVCVDIAMAIILFK